MKKFLKVIYILIALVFLGYLALPGPEYPTPPPGSLQSNEPGDTEDPLRRAYFTDATREEVMQHYVEEFNSLPAINFNVPTYRLNYPPEEAQTIIRDQTRSTFSEEIVHPFRESFYVNGFKPSSEKDTILIQDKEWLQKITVRYIPSNPLPRVLVGLASATLLWILVFEWESVFNRLKNRT